MTLSVCWAHVGDLHLSARDAWAGRDTLRRVVEQAAAWRAGAVDFLFLPGDNADNGFADQYAEMIAALERAPLPWYVVPGDHDYEPGTLDAYRAAIPAAHRPETVSIAGHRCIFVDIVSAGAGGPDFRLTMHHRNRLAEELARAAARDEVPLVFMHAYPGDLAADGDAVAAMLADAGVVLVDTGHTHFNELLNDGRVIYAATRSSAQIEEDGGRAGFSVVCVHDRVPSWRFRTLDAAWPHVQIVAPCDRRLVTRPADPRQVARPGTVEVVARLIGASPSDVPMLRADDDAAQSMSPLSDALWRGSVRLDAGLHAIEVTCGAGRDAIDLLVRSEDAIPKRRPPVALGRECHALGAWPLAGIDGHQLGPNKNGCGW